MPSQPTNTPTPISDLPIAPITPKPRFERENIHTNSMLGSKYINLDNQCENLGSIMGTLDQNHPARIQLCGTYKNCLQSNAMNKKWMSSTKYKFDGSGDVGDFYNVVADCYKDVFGDEKWDTSKESSDGHLKYGMNVIALAKKGNVLGSKYEDYVNKLDDSEDSKELKSYTQTIKESVHKFMNVDAGDDLVKDLKYLNLANCVDNSGGNNDKILRCKHQFDSNIFSKKANIYSDVYGINMGIIDLKNMCETPDSHKKILKDIFEKEDRDSWTESRRNGFDENDRYKHFESLNKECPVRVVACSQYVNCLRDSPGVYGAKQFMTINQFNLNKDFVHALEKCDKHLFLSKKDANESRLKYPSKC